MPQRPNHVIIQDVLQGTCISFLRLQQQWICPNQTPLDPTARRPPAADGSAPAARHEYLTHREKANLDSQEVHDITRFCICRLRSMIYEYSGFIIFSGEY